MKLTQREKTLIVSALREAIESRASLIDAYRTQFQRGPMGYAKPKIVPKADRPIIATWRRRIAAWKRILTALDG